MQRDLKYIEPKSRITKKVYLKKDIRSRIIRLKKNGIRERYDNKVQNFIQNIKKRKNSLIN